MSIMFNQICINKEMLLIYIYIEEYIFRQQVIIQANFVDDGTQFIIFNFIFSRLLAIFLVSGSTW